MIPVLMGHLASPIKLNREYGHQGVPVSAGTLGFEPKYTAPKAAVLPLDDIPTKFSNSPEVVDGKPAYH